MLKLRCFTLVYFLLFFTPSVFAQSDSIVYLKFLEPKPIYTSNKDSAYYYTYPAKNDSINGSVTIYYIEGGKYAEYFFINQLKNGVETIWDKEGYKYLETNFKDGLRNGLEYHWNKEEFIYLECNYINNLKNGEETSWYNNKKIKAKGVYQNNKKTGIHLYYPPDSNFYFKDVFKDGILVSGKKFNSKNKVVLKYKEVEIAAEFNGGNKAMYKYFKSKIKYPEKEEKAGVQGKVFVSFEIDKAGNVINPRIYTGITNNMNQEALRVVKEMPKWKPATLRGEPFSMKFTLPLHFKLP